MLYLSIHHLFTRTMGDDDIIHVVVGLGSVIDNFFFLLQRIWIFSNPRFLSRLLVTGNFFFLISWCRICTRCVVITIRCVLGLNILFSKEKMFDIWCRKAILITQKKRRTKTFYSTLKSWSIKHPKPLNAVCKIRS